MSIYRQIVDGFSRYIDAVATSFVALNERFASRRAARLVEEKDGVFVLDGTPTSASRLQVANGAVVGEVPADIAAALRGSRVQVSLQPSRFLFRPLELPARAAEFLEGVVRAQIDRLTPWSGADAVFGWTKPVPSGPDRISVTVAATARALVMPLVQALSAAGAASVSLLTASGDASSAAPITVFAGSASGTVDQRRVRRALVSVLLVAGLVAAASLGATTIYSGYLAHREDELARRIAERRSALLGARDATGDPATTAQRALERRKHESPLAVIVLEALAQILPDHTYVTELRIEGDKLRLVGISRDAPSLIGLMEQSSQFTRATFFAPTTRSPTDPGERFHIEARIEPNVAPRS
jgi:general secretion pathway protein L